VGIASSVSYYVRSKVQQVALLRCLGASAKQAVLVYLLQLTLAAFVGATIGVALGGLVQWLVPKLLAGVLPIEVPEGINLLVLAEVWLAGWVISMLFALLPLPQLAYVNPLLVLRQNTVRPNSSARIFQWVIALLILLVAIAIVWVFSGKWQLALYYNLGVLVALAALYALAQAVLVLTRKWLPESWPFQVRQAFGSLFRPGNQTALLLVVLGLGSGILSLLFMVQAILLDAVRLSAAEEQPNTVLFDIQPRQLEGVQQLLAANQLPILQQVPVVSMRLQQINGTYRSQNKADSSSNYPDWAFRREYRVTYRDSTIASEKTVAGNWPAATGITGISLEEGFAENLGVELGDNLQFMVQGVPMQAEVAHLREVEWQRVQTNFLVLFPSGMLEDAPQFSVIMTRTPGKAASATFQQQLISAFPNVSVIDLSLILRTLEEVVQKVRFIVEFMALLSLSTGLFILAVTVVQSRYQRIKEAVLLRTLGATSATVLTVNALEYALLGLLAALAGSIISAGGVWLLAKFAFELPMQLPWLPLLGLLLAVPLLAVVIGALNIRSLLAHAPLEAIRAEA
jgi:putative ABC transport system permease protein